MELTKLFEVQRKLDEEIEKKHPTEKMDRIDKKFLALFTEIGECANEFRGFKFWSKNQNAREKIYTTEAATMENAAYYRCSECEEESKKEDVRLETLFGKSVEECPECDEGNLFAFRYKNPLLEEYVDSLHFILSLGLEFGFETINFKNKLTEYEDAIERTLTRQFNSVFYQATQFESDYQEDDFIKLVLAYIALGEMLGFAWDQVETAYLEKNVENYKRQERGY